MFRPPRRRLSTAGKRQTVNYFVHITHVPQLRQEHLVTVPEITVPQWHTRKVRQMGGQRRKSRAASHPLLGFLLSMIARHNEKWTSITSHGDAALLRCCVDALMRLHLRTETRSGGSIKLLLLVKSGVGRGDTGLESRKVTKDSVFLHNSCTQSRIKHTTVRELQPLNHIKSFHTITQLIHLTSRFRSLDSVETTVSSQILKTLFILP